MQRHTLTSQYVQQIAPNSGAASSFALAAGTTDVNSSAVDLTTVGGAQSISFLLLLGVIAAGGGGTFKLQNSDDGSTWADVAGTAQTWTATDDDKMIGCEISVPKKRYWRVSLTRDDGGNSEIKSLLFIADFVRSEPVTQSTGNGQFVRAPELFASPAQGTA